MILSDEAIEELVKEVATEEAVQLVVLIKNKENVSEFKLADKLKITVNQVRNLLYRLHAKDLVSFTRKKDKKKGWYIYYWSFNHAQAKNLLFFLKRKKIEELKKLLKQEEGGNFFSCPEKCVRLQFNDAMEYQYKCPECGKVLIREENPKRIEKIKQQIQKLEDELSGRVAILVEEKIKPKPRKVKRKIKRKAKKAKKKAEKVKKKAKKKKPKKAKKKAKKKVKKKKTKKAKKKTKKRAKKKTKKKQKKKKAKKKHKR